MIFPHRNESLMRKIARRFAYFHRWGNGIVMALIKATYSATVGGSVPTIGTWI